MEVIGRKTTRSSSTPKRRSSEEIEKERKEGNKLVKGVFRCHEPRGGEVTIVWKEFKGDPVRRWTLKDSCEYEIPVGLAKHINTNCGYYVHSNILGPDGNPSVDLKGKYISRMNFESLEYYK